MRLVFLLASVTAAMASGADNTGGNGYANSFSYGNGQGYGFSGSFGSGGEESAGPGRSGVGGSGAVGGSIPPNFPPFNFNDLFDMFQKLNQELTSAKLPLYAYSFTNAGSNSRVQAKSSITYTKKGLQNQQNGIFSGGYGFPHGYPSQGGGGYGGGFSTFDGQGSHNSGGFSGTFGDQGASASAVIGPGGAHQTASVYPQNPELPNVNTRFSSSPGGNSYGVFTSSQSFSSDVNGKPMSYHQASTTINDNGKIKTYTVHNP